jgi:hypothetical protein
MEGNHQSTHPSAKGGAIAKASQPRARKTARCRSIRSTTKQRSTVKMPSANFEHFSPKKVRKVLNAHVKSLAEAVDESTHHSDHSQKTHDELGDYMTDSVDAVQGILNWAVLENGTAFDWLHKTLLIIADTWDNINSIPFRGQCASWSIANQDASFSLSIKLSVRPERSTFPTFPIENPKDLLQLAWQELPAFPVTPERPFEKSCRVPR